MRVLNRVLEVVKAMRTLGDPTAESIANELVAAIADDMYDEYGMEQSMRVLHAMSNMDCSYDEFADAVQKYREPIQGEGTVDDWEWVFYALLMLTEPKNEEASDA